IALTFKTPYSQGDRALHIVRRQLDRMGFDRIKPREVLMETAQFYSILARRDEDWEFVHRTIHDFLGAQHWVETGGFANVTRSEWNARTAYAACLAGDSTEVLESALAAKEGLPTATEILSNAPRFDIKRITKAIIK